MLCGSSKSKNSSRFCPRDFFASVESFAYAAVYAVCVAEDMSVFACQGVIVHSMRKLASHLLELRMPS